jgi:carbon storage regulator
MGIVYIFINFSNFKGVKLMLVLTRRAGETVMMGNDISITVLSVQGGQVRIGMDAPQAIKIYRQEIYDRIPVESQENAGEEES